MQIEFQILKQVLNVMCGCILVSLRQEMRKEKKGQTTNIPLWHFCNSSASFFKKQKYCINYCTCNIVFFEVLPTVRF